MDFIKDSSNSGAQKSSDSLTYEWMDEKTKGEKGTLSLWGSLAFPSAPLMTDIREIHHCNELAVELDAAGMILVRGVLSVRLHVQT